MGLAVQRWTRQDDLRLVAKAVEIITHGCGLKCWRYQILSTVTPADGLENCGCCPHNGIAYMLTLRSWILHQEMLQADAAKQANTPNWKIIHFTVGPCLVSHTRHALSYIEPKWFQREWTAPVWRLQSWHVAARLKPQKLRCLETSNNMQHQSSFRWPFLHLSMGSSSRTMFQDRLLGTRLTKPF